jgi:hypothetical protein
MDNIIDEDDAERIASDANGIRQRQRHITQLRIMLDRLRECANTDFEGAWLAMKISVPYTANEAQCEVSVDTAIRIAEEAMERAVKQVTMLSESLRSRLSTK